MKDKGKAKNLSVVYQPILFYCLLLLKWGLQAENWFILFLKILMTFLRLECPISSNNTGGLRHLQGKNKNLMEGGRDSDGREFGHFLNDLPCPPIMENPEDSPIINRYICFEKNYFCFYYVQVTNVQMHT